MCEYIWLYLSTFEYIWVHLSTFEYINQLPFNNFWRTYYVLQREALNRPFLISDIGGKKTTFFLYYPKFDNFLIFRLFWILIWYFWFLSILDIEMEAEIHKQLWKTRFRFRLAFRHRFLLIFRLNREPWTLQNIGFSRQEP